jgi:superkiller protein 3
MPNGGLPPTSIRLTLIRDDGTTDFVFTDSKGKFQLPTPRTQSVNYRVIIEGDKQSYDTTTANLTLDRNSPNQLNIFLKPITTTPRRAADGVLDVTNYEETVPAKARAAYKRGMEAVNQGHAEAAITNLEEAIRIHPQYVRALNDLGVVYLKLERFEEAEATFRKAIEVNKRFFHPRLNLGLVLEKEGKYQEALEVLEPLYNENHGMLEVCMAYATALDRTGRLDEAQKLFKAVAEAKNLAQSVRADAHFGLGLILNRQGKYVDAVVQLQKSIQLAPNAMNAHLQLGAAYLQLKDLAGAEHELLKAYELGGKAAGAAQLMLGQIYYEEKRYADAERAFAQYLKDVPSAPNAAQILQLIADLKVTRRN